MDSIRDHPVALCSSKTPTNGTGLCERMHHEREHELHHAVCTRPYRLATGMEP